jgi:parvulin-like peptidyl-prolyl isomerase
MWENDERQQLIVTVGFIALVVIALLILAGAVGATYYNDHLRAVARVDGIDINADQLADRKKVDTFRIDEFERKLQAAVASGQLDSGTANSEAQTLEQQRSGIDQNALDELVDLTLQTKLAKDQGITVTDADVDAALKKEASAPEQRKVLAIFVRPETTGTASTPNELQLATAKASADKALADLTAGKPFDQVAKQYSTDASKDKGGDFGYITSSDTTDTAWVAAVFALPLNGTTGVIQGLDGTYRIGRVTDIVPVRTDDKYTDRISAAVSLSAYRENLRSEEYKQKLSDRIVAQASTGNVDQVHVSEIKVTTTNPSSDPSATGPEIEASHILFSPKGDPTNASKVPATDPSWEEAHQKAIAEVAKLRAITDPQKRADEFAALAKTDSNDTGSGASGGSLGYFTRASMVKEFADPLFDGTFTKYQILDPVKSQFGWHVIMFVDKRPPAEDRIKQIQKQIQAPGADFAAIAKANSDAADASTGGDMGWVARLQLDKKTEDILFDLQAGQVSDTITQSDGLYIYKVTERGSRAVDATQLSTLQSSAFTNWYTPQKDKADIWHAPDVSNPLLVNGG